MKRYHFWVSLSLSVDASSLEDATDKLTDAVLDEVSRGMYAYECYYAEDEDWVMADEMYDEMKIREVE